MVNVRSNYSIAEQYNIRSVPTFIYTEHGKEIRRRTGARSHSALVRMCRSGWTL